MVETLDRAHLVQLQADRLTVNWRRMNDHPYPRYPEVKSRLERVWHDLLQVAGVVPSTNQVEVTYVNRIAKSPETVLRGWGNPICTQDDGRFNAVFEESLELSGATKARGQTAVRGKYGEPPETLLSLMIRAVPARADMPIGAIDAARLYIVTRFRDITDASMHEEWGFVDDSDA